MSQQQAPSWNNYFHRDQPYDTTYTPVEEPARLSYFPYKQEGGGNGDEEKSHGNPEDPSFWKTPGNEHANVTPSAPPPPESLYGEREGLENDEEYAREILREEHARNSQQPGSGSHYPPGEAEKYYIDGVSDPMQAGIQGPPPINTPKIPKAYRDPYVQQQLVKKKFWRPYFTYLVTLIQTVLLIYELIYNLKETGSLIQTNPINILIGPDPTVLIGLGERFAPCMKFVPSLPPTANISCTSTTPSSTCTLEALCGLGGFNNGLPNQWFRFITPIFLHGGILHFLFNIAFQIVTGRQVESDIGWWRYGIVYMGSGIFGFIFGGNFSSPTIPSLGASGSLFGIIGILLLDLLQNWKFVINPCWELTKLLLIIIITFLIGLLPMIDNFSHIGGFIMGILLGLILMPTINFSKIHKRFNWILRIIAFPIATLLFFLLIRNFYNSDPTQTCPWCKYLNCIPINGWCDMNGMNGTSVIPR